jgi:methionyl-tRNA formyltransferase
MRIAFMGTPVFAATSLAALARTDHKIVAVYSQPARAKGRGMKPTPSPVEALATELGLPTYSPVSLRNAEAQADFAALNLDLAIVAAYGLILPKAILAAPRLGCINIHASLLPRWRGAAPIERAILAGDSETGITLMAMDEGLDTGGMIATRRVPIGHGATGGSLHDTLAALGAELLLATLPEIATITPVPQPSDGVTYAAKRGPADLRLDWRESADALDRRIRAFAPSPGCYGELGAERIKILKATPVKGSGEPGVFLDDRLTVACGDGALRLDRLQRPGRGPLDASELLRGFAVAAGQRFTL